MIRLIRPSAVPSVLQSGSVTRTKAEGNVAAILANGGIPRSVDFKAIWRNKIVLRTLAEMHGLRCCYCERLRDTSRESDVEHIR